MRNRCGASWYFDFVDPQPGIGGWVRLGLIPNQHTAWITALLCGPDMPTVAVVDFGVELPHDPGDVRTETVELTLAAATPLQDYLGAAWPRPGL